MDDNLSKPKKAIKKYDHFEDVLREVGSLGYYQWFVWAVMQYSNLLQTMNQNFMAFGKIEPPWRCKGNLGVNGTTINYTSIQDDTITNISQIDRNTYSPSKAYKCPDFNNCTLDTDRIEFKSQVLEWKLYCDEYYVPMFVVSLQMLGIIPGALIFNHLIDNYGRRWSCHLLNAGVLAVSLCSAFANNWQQFIVARFFIGFLFGGLFLVSVVIQMEIIQESDRMWIYALDFWSVANGVLALLAYLTGDWSRLIIVSNCVCIPLLFVHFFVKESPRWLLQKHRYDEAAQILNDIARWNRKKNVHIDRESLKEMVESRSARLDMQNSAHKKLKQYTILDIFHSCKSTIHFFTLAYAWLATSCMSYGLVYQNTAYTGSPFVNYAVAASFRVVTQVIVFSADKFLKVRRRVMYLTSLGLVVAMLTIMTVVTIAADPEKNHAAATTQRIVGLICSGSMSALWLIVYLLPIEIFPTVIRSIAMGGCSIAARIGGVLGPQFLFLTKFWMPTPFVGFTVVSVINFITIFIFLPETRGTRLPDYLNEPLDTETHPHQEKPAEEQLMMDEMKKEEDSGIK